ncbi:MAG: hypothetical protein LQ348_006867 [Seirophora lacunosa]|nr:MAG: hypothetical protein LQ348_006867 [Seirophora lacunosa]
MVVGGLGEREGEDKGLEREKRRERKEKRKRREREERAEGEGVVLVPFEGEDAVSDDDGSAGLELGVESEEEHGGDAEPGKKQRQGKKGQQQSETLEDLEAMASGLLA